MKKLRMKVQPKGFNSCTEESIEEGCKNLLYMLKETEPGEKLEVSVADS